MNLYLTFLTFCSHSSKYGVWYRSLISKALDRGNDKSQLIKELGYVELHHILPICMCFDTSQKKDKRNLVYLTAKEHFLCHLILSKMFPHNYKLKYAISCFQRNRSGHRNFSAGEYAIMKRELAISVSKSNSGKPAWNRGLSLSKETRERISKSNSGKPAWNRNPNKRIALSRKEASALHSVWMKANNPMNDPDSINKIRNHALVSAKSICCMNCQRLFGPGNFVKHKYICVRR